MKKILALLLAALMAVTMIACNKKDDAEDPVIENVGASNELIYENFEYTVNEEGEYEITDFRYGGADLQDVVIPDTIHDRPVTGIAANAFKEKQNIRSITLSKNLLYIEQYAFYACDSLTKVVLPDTLTTLEKGAFSECKGLTEVVLSKNLTKIDDLAFYKCTKLEKAELPNGLVVIGDGAFSGCTALTEVVIPTTVIEIGNGAFTGCTKLSSITALEALSAEDKAILTALNKVLSDYETANEGKKPETMDDVSAILAEAGYYLGEGNGTGFKYVWDKTNKQIAGAFSAADLALIGKMNSSLANAKAAELKSLNDVEAHFVAAGLTLSDLNRVSEGNKLEWNATTNRMVRTYTLGEGIFAGVTLAPSDLSITVTPDSNMDAYAMEIGHVAVYPEAK